MCSLALDKQETRGTDLSEVSCLLKCPKITFCGLELTSFSLCSHLSVCHWWQGTLLGHIESVTINRD